MSALFPSEFPRLHDSEAGALRPGRLWSLWDMFRICAHEYITLGSWAQDVRSVLYMKDLADKGDPSGILSDDEKLHIEF